MGNNITNACEATLNSDDKILFDCNVLMYLFYTYGSYSTELVDVYKFLFHEALNNECKMFIPSIEISEFINTYIKAEYQRYLRRKHLKRMKFDFKT